MAVVVAVVVVEVVAVVVEVAEVAVEVTMAAEHAVSAVGGWSWLACYPTRTAPHSSRPPGGLSPTGRAR